MCIWWRWFDTDEGDDDDGVEMDNLTDEIYDDEDGGVALMIISIIIPRVNFQQSGQLAG